MKAGVVHAKNDIRYEEIQTPKATEGKVVVKVKYTGICGSDVPRVNGDACHFFPNVLGHEFSGTIAEVGKGVTSVKVGDRVAGIPLVPCMKCEDCQKGNYSLCKHYSFIGSREFGSFAEYVVVPEKNVVKFEDSVSFEMGALFEPATVALHGFKRLPVEGGKNIAILGGGTIGMMTAQWAKIFGAKTVTVFDVLDERLELAKRLGCQYSVNSATGDIDKAIAEITGKRGFDYVYDTCGVPATAKLALKLVCNRGGVCFIGTPSKEFTFQIPEWENILRKECIVTGSWMSYSAPFPGEEWTLVAHYFQTGDLKLDPSFIFKKMPLSKIADAFEMYKTPGLVKGKILIDSEA